MSTSDIVTAVALAEFDIDLGSCVRCKYPAHLIDDGWDMYLAEQMLPDGAERHAMSSTVVMLNRPTMGASLRRHVILFAHGERSSDGGSWSALGNGGTLIVEGGVLTLPGLPTEEAAVDIAASDVALHPFPELPEEVFAMVPLGVKIEDATFGMLRLGNRMFGVLCTSAGDFSDIESALNAAAASSHSGTTPPAPPQRSTPSYDGGATLYGLNVLVTKKDSNVRRGGINKSIAVFGPNLTLLQPLKPLLLMALDLCCEIYGNDEDAIEAQRRILRRLCEVLGSGYASVSSALSGLQPADRNCAVHATGHAHQAAIKAVFPFVSGAPTTLAIPLHQPLSDIPLQSTSVSSLLLRLQKGFFQLLTCMLCGKRAVLISRQGTPEELCDAVVALGSCIDPFIPDYVQTRLFPYTSINCMDLFLSLPGYVVGTHNPMFDNKKDWRDMMVDLDNNTTSVNETATFLTEAAHVGSDEAVCSKIIQRLEQMKAQRQSPQEIEVTCRAMVRDYLWRLFTVAANPDAAPSSWTQELMETNSQRFVAMELSGVLESFKGRLTDHKKNEAAIWTAAVQLRRGDVVEDYEIMQLLQNLLKRLGSEDSDVIELLACFPSENGGLVPLVQLLFHASLAVRLLAMSLLHRIDEVPVGRLCISRLNSFMILTFEQLKRELPDTSGAFKS